MRHDSRYEKLDTLGDYELENSSQDIRGRPLLSPSGEKFGTVEDLMVDREKNRVTAIRLENGKICAVEPLEIHEDCVIYGEAAEAHAKTGGTAVATERVPIVEEKVAIGKRVADHGKEINVTARVVKDKVTDDVHLRDETVRVDKRPVDREVSAKDAEALLKGKTVSMTEHDEEVVVGKKAVVTDEVVVSKSADDRVEHVEETARRTKVDVDVNNDRNQPKRR